MTRAADLAKLIAGGGTITVDDNSDTLTLESTDADANVGPVLNLHRNSASPADNDLVGRIVFKADDDAGNAATFARIETTATDVSNGGEDGRLDFFTAKDDAFTAALSILGTNVGVGTTSPNAKLAVSGTGTVDLGIGSTNAGGAYLYLDGDSNGDFSGSDYSYIGHDTSGQLLIHQDSPSGSDNILLKTNGSTRWTLNSSGNLFPAATTQGIVLGATSDTEANRLDDYEEGEFDATMANSVTLHSGNNRLSYTKIGRQVTVMGQIRVSSSNTNALVLNNLPFTAMSGTENSAYAYCNVRLYEHNMADDAQFVGAYIDPNSTNLYFANVKDNSATTQLAATQNGYLMFTITYFAA